MNLFCSLQVVKIRNWHVKASSFDDQILVLIYNPETLYSDIIMFYNEEQAHSYIERLAYDCSVENNNR